MRVRARFVFAMACVFAFWPLADAQQPAPAAAPAAPDLSQQYTQAMALFAAGDFGKAAADLEAFVGKVEFSPQLEPIFFTIGSAYFNAANYPKAIAAFTTYQAKFPGGPHALDASVAIAQCSLQAKNYTAAASQFAALEKDPRLRDQVLLLQATALKDGNKIDQAIPVLEKLTSGEMKSAPAVGGAMLLAQIYAQKGEAEKAVATLVKVHGQIRLVDNIVELNGTTVSLGDELFKKNRYAEALECYRAAYPRDQIAKMQSDRITAMQQQIETNLNAARSDPTQVGQLGSVNNQLKSDIAKAQKLLEDFQKLPDITPAIYIRLARCFYETDKKWETVVVYRELLDRFPSAPEREPSLFGLIVALAEVNQPERAMQRCEEYLRDFKNGPNAETVGYLLGASALQARDPQLAETYFGRLLEAPGKGTFREQARYLLGNAKFQAGKYAEAVDEYKRYQKDFPKGQSFEDVTYRIALTSLFAGKYEEAINLLNGYLKEYPKGAFVSDARYRLAVCKYAASLYEEVIADCKSWEADFPQNQQLGEVLALLADAYGATDREADAINTYIRSYQTANTDEVMNYSLFAASKLLQKHGEWARVSDLFTDFIKEKPDHPTVISALFWIGKAKAREGQVDEAKKITADTIKKYISNPAREPVESLLSQLAQLCVKKKKAEPSPEGSPASAVVEQQTDPGAELDQLLGETANDPSPTAKARILFAKAELARLRRQPAEEEKNIAAIADNFKPEELSPTLLGRAGDDLLGKNKFEQAKKFYDRLMDEYPKSESVDFAYNGLGEIALRKNELPKALRYFTDGTEKIAASQKLKDVTIGKAKTLLAMGRLLEARKLFEQIASVREWRGELTAQSVYSLGQIEAKQGHWAEANAYYQRVYVGYQKFLPWVAKAYLGSAESFEKLGDKKGAANTYRELLRNEKLAPLAEAEEARKKLAALGEQQG